MSRQQAIVDLAVAIIQEQVEHCAELAKDYEEQAHEAATNKEKDKAIEKYGMALMYLNAASGRSPTILETEVVQYLDECCPDTGPGSIGCALRAAVREYFIEERE
jgi:hypothetical protein